MKTPTLFSFGKHRFFLCILFSLALFRQLGFTQESSEVSAAPDKQPIQNVQPVPLELPQETTSPAAPQPKPLPTPIKLMFEPPFNPQFGFGLTGIFAQGLWGIPEGIGIYQGGLQVNFLWRIHPRVTAELSGGGLFSNQFTETGERLSEAVLSAGVRVFLKMPKDSRVKFFQILPYVTAGPEINALYPQVHYESITIGLNYYQQIEKTYPVLYLGGYVGFGAEMRIGRYFALTLDVKALAQGAIDAWGYAKEQPSPARLGVRGSLGLAFYLP